jgi:hypothetical protein
VLVVLDNALDSAQVRPLLPGEPGCLTIVTSRNQLGPLVAADAAHPVALDLLTVDEARRLLAQRLGTGRVEAEPEAVAEIITHCARLPLALAIVAARAATHPHFSLAALAAELHATKGSLDAFAGMDEATDVRAVFSWSYRKLGTPAARLFRLLSSYPGLDLDAESAAGLIGVPPDRVRPMLAELARANLLTERAPGRFTWHPLLGAYAAELTRAVGAEPG